MIERLFSLRGERACMMLMWGCGLGGRGEERGGWRGVRFGRWVELIVLGRGWVGGLVCRVRREDRCFLVRLRSYVVSMRLFCSLVCSI